MAKHHPDLIFCRKQAGVGTFHYLCRLLGLFPLRLVAVLPPEVTLIALLTSLAWISLYPSVLALMLTLQLDGYVD